ncbi:MAG TPA: hypothetical protein VFT50_03275 [Baekduia sp.]|nr:hypothetical protein [Baekduia sp.]
MSATPMNDPGAAQLELIRRYARTLRELHADAMRANGPRIGAKAAHRTSSAERFVPATRATASDAAGGTPSTLRTT